MTDTSKILYYEYLYKDRGLESPTTYFVHGNKRFKVLTDLFSCDRMECKPRKKRHEYTRIIFKRKKDIYLINYIPETQNEFIL